MYRSRLLLDQDRAVRGANLASVYEDAAMPQIALRTAARAVTDDYGNYSAHLFLANSYNALRDPRLINLRYETPWLDEFLLANLLAPVGAGTLSQYLSQNEYSRLFERDRLGVSSSTEYFSRGDWVQTGSQYGTLGNTAYAVDALYRSETGQRPNDDLQQLTLATKLKQQLTPDDSLYLQTIYFDSESGDIAQYYNPTNARPRLRIKETQEPMLLAGYHHEWQPGFHTLVLAGRLQDTYRYTDPDRPVQVGPFPAPPGLNYRSEFAAYTAEAQQICQINQHTVTLGGRYQTGSFDTQSQFDPTVLPQQTVSPDLRRLSLYAYDTWRLLEPLRLTAGVSYDRLTFPSNFRSPPISPLEETRDQLSPKAGLVWTPFVNTTLRASFTRSLGGVSYDQSFRLEPTQVGGFNQVYRSLIPESLVGATASPTFDTWGLGLDQKLATGTYVTVEGELLKSRVAQTLGRMDLAVDPRTFAPVATPAGFREQLDYRERALSLQAHQLVGKVVFAGAHYRLSEAQLHDRYPDLPATLGGPPDPNQWSVLHQATFYTGFNHASGFFGLVDALWSVQANQGYAPHRPGDDFWHLNAFVGYRFHRRAAEIKVGMLNLTDRDYRLNPLNFYEELYRQRTFMVSFKFIF